MSNQIAIKHNLEFDYDKYGWCVLVGWQMGRLEFIFKNQNFDPATNQLLAQTQSEILSYIKPLLGAKGITLHDEVETFQEMASALMRDLEIVSGRVFSFYMIGMACCRISTGVATQDRDKKRMMLDLAKSCIMSIPSQYLQSKNELFDEMVRHGFSGIVEVTDFLSSLKNASETKEQESDEQVSRSDDVTLKTTILFLAADPSDASRLRLGQEIREIQEKLQMARIRDQFKLAQRMSVRPVDISQAILDEQPTLVHFSGHGTGAGELCFENEVGQLQTVQPEALAALFKLFSDQVDCVLMNACYSATQAEAIAKHIKYVIGMNKAIGDKAAISFAVGFYQALGAGKSIENAYDFGCVQIRLQSIPEHLTPVLIKKRKTRRSLS